MHGQEAQLAPLSPRAEPERQQRRRGINAKRFLCPGFQGHGLAAGPLRALTSTLHSVVRWQQTGPRENRQPLSEEKLLIQRASGARDYKVARRYRSKGTGLA